MTDGDLDGFDSATAREVVLGYIRSLKVTQAQLRTAIDDVRTWEGRIKLAGERGEPELKSRAQARLGPALAARDALAVEERELMSIVLRLKREFATVRTAPVLSGVDAEFVLAELRGIVGERDALADEFQDAEATRDLNELKRRMAGDPE